MKKTHLLWKILVVVMIISAMMATFIACGGHDCDKDGHIDENKDYWCDVCEADMCPGHVDTDPRDKKCDVCGHDVDSCALEFHVDTNPADHVCDDCGAIVADSEPWYNLIADLDKVIASMGSMGQLATMGGSLTAGIDFVQGNDKRDIDLALDLGLQLVEFADEDINGGSGNAFGFSIMDDGARIFGLWYVDNGRANDNYILGQFGKLGAEGTEVIKFKAPSLAETFNTYPINVNVDIDKEVEGVNLSSQAAMIAGAVASLLPLDEKTEGNTTTYSIALTNFLFNENFAKPINPHTIGSLLAGLAGSDDSNAIYKLLSVLGLETNLMTLLSDLLPGLTLDIAFTKDTNGNTTGAALGLGIAGEDGMKLDFYTGEDGTPSGVLTDIFSVEAAGKDHLVITDKFEDIDLDVSLSYEFGRNDYDSTQQKYTQAVKAALADVEAEFDEAAVTPVEIGLLNIALETDITLGLNDATAQTYNLTLAASLDPSALTTPGLLKDVYVVDGEGKGAWTDKNGNGKYDNGEENKTVAINFGEDRNAVDVVLEMIDSLYLSLTVADGSGSFEVSLAEDPTFDDEGKVSSAKINISGIPFLSGFLGGFLDAKTAAEVDSILTKYFGDKPVTGLDLTSLGDLGGIIGGFIKIKGVSDTKPTAWQEHKDEESKDEAAAKETKAADSEVDAMDVIGQIADYIKMFAINRDGDKVSVSIDNANMNGAVIDFDATASALRDADKKVNGLKLELGETGLVIKGSDKVNTTITLDDPLQIGGDGNLFSVQVTAKVEDTRDNKEGGDKSMKLTLGLDVKKLGYGIVRGLVQNETDFNNLFSENLDHLYLAK